MSIEVRSSAASMTRMREPVAILPAPTQDLAEGLANIREFGFTIYPDLRAGAELQSVREALFREAEWDRKPGSGGLNR